MPCMCVRPADQNSEKSLYTLKLTSFIVKYRNVYCKTSLAKLKHYDYGV